VAGMAFTLTADVEITVGFESREIDANAITNRIESIQKKINTARVQAGSQYAALESAVNYTTDLTAQYELAYNTVHDVNFSMETAHLAKNQILQQAATAMLAQANEGQQGLLQLIQ
jgi:flagellin